MSDHAAVAIAAHRRLTVLGVKVAAAQSERAVAVRALRDVEGWSYGRIAVLLGVSRNRVVQLLK